MKKQKAKFTVIDALIILVILAAIAVGVKMLMPKFVSSAETEKVECTVLISSAEWELAEAMHEGDRVTMSLTEKDGGIIKGVEAKPAEKTVFDSINGLYVTQTVDNKCDIYVTIELDAEVSDIAIKTGTTVVQVGKDSPVRGKGYASTGYVIALND